MDENRNEIEGQVKEVCVYFHGLGLLEQFGVTIRGMILIFLSRNLFTPATGFRDESY
jgi:hypothetical protein